MPDPFAVPDDLDAIVDDIWSRLVRGCADRRSAFHTPTVASVAPDGTLAQRVMVLRKTDRALATLRFHTDARSTKVAQVDGRAVAVLVYDAGAKIQIRVGGTATLHTDGAAVDTAWAAISASGRRSYLTTLAPGTGVDAATSGLPAALEASPDLASTEHGRANFAIVVVALDRLEWLHLAHSGHRRACFVRNGEAWRGQWLIP